MTRQRLPRRLVLGLILLLALSAGALYYAYENLDSILRGQIAQSLQEFGVEDYTLAGARLERGKFSVDSIGLQGTFENFTYKASLASLEVFYDWRVLLTRTISAVHLAEIDIMISGTTAASRSGTALLNMRELKPTALISRLPVASLDIRQWSLAYHSPGIPPLIASGDFRVANDAKMALQTSLGNATLHAVLSTDKDSSATRLALDIIGVHGDIAAVSAHLQPAATGDWDWRLHGNWAHALLQEWLRQVSDELDLDLAIPQAQEFAITGRGSLDVQLRHPDQLELPLTAGLVNTPAFALDAELTASIEDLDYFGAVHDLAGALDASLSLRAGELALTLQPVLVAGMLHSERVPLSRDVLQWLQWEKTVPIEWHNSEPVHISYDGETWSVQAQDTRLQVGGLRSRIRLDINTLSADLSGDTGALLHTNLEAAVQTLVREQALFPLQLAFRQQGDAGSSNYNTSVTNAETALDIGLEGTVDRQSGKGSHRLALALKRLPAFSRAVIPTLRKLGLLNADPEITAGTLKLESTVSTAGSDPSSWSPESRLAIEGVSANYDGYELDNFSLFARWLGLDRWQTTQPVSLSLERLDVGVEVRDIVARGSLATATPIAHPRVTVEEFSARVFGGTLFLPKPESWDFSAPSNSVTLRAQQWQLAEMVALQQNRDIHAQGTLEGELPVTLSDGKLVIEKGFLRALPPGGTIRYVANDASRAMGSNNRELALALDLLSDFRYEVLRSSVNLDQRGNLLFGLSLGGRNPDRFEGRPINFNINLEQNIEPLLQTLRLSDKLTGNIENRLN